MGQQSKRNGKSGIPAAPPASTTLSRYLALEQRVLLDAAAVETAGQVLGASAQAGDSVAPNASDLLAALDSLGGMAPPVSGGRDIVFVDASIKDYQSLLQGIDPAAEIHLLDSGDWAGQIQAALAGHSGDVQSIHLISHGSAGQLRFGDVVVSEANLGDFDAAWSAMRTALTADGDLLVYGCEAGADGTGLSFLQALSERTGADVAGSDDLTGSADLGGDWDLEIAVGEIATPKLYRDASGAFHGTLIDQWVQDTTTGTGTPEVATGAGGGAAMTRTASGTAGVERDWKFVGIPGSGKVDIYYRDTNTVSGDWLQYTAQNALFDKPDTYQFGFDIAAAGNRFVVGAPGVDGSGSDDGLAYSYEWRNYTTEVQNITVTSNQSSDSGFSDRRFNLSVGSATTGDILWNTDDATLRDRISTVMNQAAFLNALGVSSISVTVIATDKYQITFDDVASDLANITASGWNEMGAYNFLQENVSLTTNLRWVEKVIPYQASAQYSSTQSQSDDGSDQYGYSVDIAWNGGSTYWIIVGNPGEDYRSNNSLNVGSAFLWTDSGAGYTMTAQFSGYADRAGEEFSAGSAVAVSYDVSRNEYWVAIGYGGVVGAQVWVWKNPVGENWRIKDAAAYAALSTKPTTTVDDYPDLIVSNWMLGGNNDISMHDDFLAIGNSSQETQQITFNSDINGGTFTLTVDGVTTAAIAFDETEATLATNIQSAVTAVLEAAGKGSVIVTTTGADTFRVRFNSPGNKPLITVNGSSLETTLFGSNSVTVTVIADGNSDGIVVYQLSAAGVWSQMTSLQVGNNSVVYVRDTDTTAGGTGTAELAFSFSGFTDGLTNPDTVYPDSTYIAIWDGTQWVGNRINDRAEVAVALNRNYSPGTATDLVGVGASNSVSYHYNWAPTVDDESDTTDEDTSLVVTVLDAGDYDQNINGFPTIPAVSPARSIFGDVLAITAVNGVTSGAATTTLGASVTFASGSITYNPTGSATLQGLKLGESMVDTLSVTISDGKGGTTNCTVSITVDGRNDAPIFDQTPTVPLGIQQSASTVAYDFAPYFKDIDTDEDATLVYETTVLPGAEWSVGGTGSPMNITAPAGIAAGDYVIKIQAKDVNGAYSAEQSFVIRIDHVNDAPVVANEIPSQVALSGYRFSFAVPVSTFGDSDPAPYDTMTYAATLASGAALPSWLSFDPVTRTFSGTPAAGDVTPTTPLTVRVTATDGTDAASRQRGTNYSVSADFKLMIVDGSVKTVAPLADGPSANANYGFSTALSDDGQWMIVGAPRDNHNAAGDPEGSAWLYQWNGTTFANPIRINSPVTSGGTPGVTTDVAIYGVQFGWSVDIEKTATAGTYKIAIGARGENGGQGAVYCYTLTGTTLSAAIRLGATGATANDYFGTSLALNENGTRLIIGASHYNYDPDAGGPLTTLSDAGAAFELAFPTAANAALAPNVLSADAASFDLFGGSVAYDRGLIAVAATGDDSATYTNQGAVYLYSAVSGTVTFLSKMQAADGRGSDQLGWAIDLDVFNQGGADQSAVLVASSIYNDQAATDGGAVYVWRAQGLQSGTGHIGPDNNWNGTWTLQNKITSFDSTTGDYFGSDVAYDYDEATNGERLLVGAQFEDSNGDYAGAVYGYVYSSTVGTFLPEKFVDSAPQGGSQTLSAFFGNSVDVAGTRAVFGARWRDDATAQANDGAVFWANLMTQGHFNFVTLAEVSQSGSFFLPVSQSELVDLDTSSAQGEVSFTADGKLVYKAGSAFKTLGAGQTATDTFSYTTEQNGVTMTTTVQITVNGQDDQVVAATDVIHVAANAVTRIDVLANDADAENPLASLSILSLQPTSLQGAVFNAGDSILYDPRGKFASLRAGETVQETLSYTVVDASGATSTGYVTLLVTGADDPVVAVNDSVTVKVGGAVKVDLLANDTDADGAGTFWISAIDTSAARGYVFANADGTLTYSPGADFAYLKAGETAVDRIVYTVTDLSGNQSTAMLEVLVVGVNDAPVAMHDAVSVAGSASTMVDVLANDTDPDGDKLHITRLITTGTLGQVSLAADGTILYTAPGTTVPDSFSYEVVDSLGKTSIATVYVNHPDGVPGTGAVNDVAVVRGMSPVSIALTANDGGDAVVTGVSADGAAGSLTLGEDGVAVYTPDAALAKLPAGRVFVDTFTYTVAYGDGSTGSATLRVYVNGQYVAPALDLEEDERFVLPETVRIEASILVPSATPASEAVGPQVPPVDNVAHLALQGLIEMSSIKAQQAEAPAAPAEAAPAAEQPAQPVEVGKPGLSAVLGRHVLEKRAGVDALLRHFADHAA